MITNYESMRGSRKIQDDDFSNVGLQVLLEFDLFGCLGAISAKLPL